MTKLDDFSKIIHNGHELGKVLHQGKIIWEKGIYTAKDSDFVKVNGNWVYRGTELEIKIPHVIQGKSITSYKYMFSGSSTYNAAPVIIVVSDNPNVTNMSYMFYYSAATTLDLSSFDTSKVTDMSGMFWSSKATTLDVSSFNTSNVTNMSYMFNGSAATTLDLSSFDTSKVTDMSGMFRNSKATTLDLSSFDTSNVTDMRNMFSNSVATVGYARTQADADRFNASSDKPAGLNFVVKPVYTAQDSDFVKVDGFWVYRGTELEIKIPHVIQGESITSYQNMFSGGSIYNATPVTRVVSDNPNVTDMSNMFGNSKATTLDLSSFDTSNVTNMSYMFNRSAATTLDLSSFDTSKVTSMRFMFNNSAATTLDLSSFDTSKVTDMSNMFSNSKATTLDLSSFDTSNVTNMSYMFNRSAATTLDLSSFDTSKVTDMRFMFDSSAATVGYARTQADADKFNSSSNKPTKLKFVVKP